MTSERVSNDSGNLCARTCTHVRRRPLCSICTGECLLLQRGNSHHSRGTEATQTGHAAPGQDLSASRVAHRVDQLISYSTYFSRRRPNCRDIANDSRSIADTLNCPASMRFRVHCSRHKVGEQQRAKWIHSAQVRLGVASYKKHEQIQSQIFDHAQIPESNIIASLYVLRSSISRFLSFVSVSSSSRSEPNRDSL